MDDDTLMEDDIAGIEIHGDFGSPDVRNVEDEKNEDVVVKHPWLLSDFSVQSKEIGDGKFSKVFVAREKKSNFVVIIKAIKSEIFDENPNVPRAQLQNQLKREILIHSRMYHPNIGRLYGMFYDSSGRIHLILEYLSGGTLFESLTAEKAGRMREEKAAYYVHGVALALKHIHSLDIIHRDIKPENLCFDFKGKLKLIDFGTAVHSPRNRRNSFYGTVDYIAKEVVDQEPYGRSVDMWCLGAMTFELITGQTPFYDPQQHLTLQKISRMDFKFPDYVSEEARSFINGLLTTQEKRMPLEQLLDHPWLESRHRFENRVSFSSCLDGEYPVKSFPFNENNEERENFPEIVFDEDDENSVLVTFERIGMENNFILIHENSSFRKFKTQLEKKEMLELEKKQLIVTKFFETLREEGSYSDNPLFRSPIPKKQSKKFLGANKQQPLLFTPFTPNVKNPQNNETDNENALGWNSNPFFSPRTQMRTEYMKRKKLDISEEFSPINEFSDDKMRNDEDIKNIVTHLQEDGEIIEEDGERLIELDPSHLDNIGEDISKEFGKDLNETDEHFDSISKDLTEEFNLQAFNNDELSRRNRRLSESRIKKENVNIHGKSRREEQELKGDEIELTEKDISKEFIVIQKMNQDLIAENHHLRLKIDELKKQKDHISQIALSNFERQNLYFTKEKREEFRRSYNDFLVTASKDSPRVFSRENYMYLKQRSLSRINDVKKKKKKKGEKFF